MDNETMTAVPMSVPTALMPVTPIVATQEDTTPAGMTYVSDIIGEAYKGWENGRVIFDCGTGRGKNEFILRKLADYAIDRLLKSGKNRHRILYLCPLNALYVDMTKRRREAFLAVFGEAMADEWDIYETVLEIQTYQHLETLRRNNPAALENYLKQFKYIVADECHYFTDFSSYNINTYLSLEVLQNAEADHVVIYMSATGEQTYKLLDDTSKTSADRIYKLPQDYSHIKQWYFYSREKLVMMLNSLPADEEAVIFVSSGEDLLKMKQVFGDTAAYYCSENNPKYGRQFDNLTDCIENRELKKQFLFTTKAFGVGVEIKDRTVKHLYIDQWKPIDIIPSVGRKRPLDADDTCTVYFRDYDADWYHGGLKKFKAIVEEELKPVLAYLAGPEAFEKYRNSGMPDSINKKIKKCKIMEFDNAKDEYRVNPLGVRQLTYETEMLGKMIDTDDRYKKYFATYVPELVKGVQQYRVDVLADWISAHLNQPMLKEEMYESIMALNVFKEYKGRPMGQDILNRKLQIYGVEIVTVRDRRRVKDGKKNDTRDATFWKLIQI